MSTEYDERLLASAPAATRKEKQEGYNIDLLESNRGGAQSGSSTPPVPILAPNADYAENGNRPKEVAGADFSTSRHISATPTPWYKTRKGLIILFIVAIVVIAAVVGGAVGGTVGKHKKSNTDASTDGQGGTGGVSAGAGPIGAGGAAPVNNSSSPSGTSTSVVTGISLPTQSPSISGGNNGGIGSSSEFNAANVAYDVSGLSGAQ